MARKLPRYAISCSSCWVVLVGADEVHWRGPVITTRVADGVPHRDLRGLWPFCKACATKQDEGVASQQS